LPQDDTGYESGQSGRHLANNLISDNAVSSSDAS
jgi:hypothetical protein